jgi:hypothetical protein
MVKSELCIGTSAFGIERRLATRGENVRVLDVPELCIIS